MKKILLEGSNKNLRLVANSPGKQSNQKNPNHQGDVRRDHQRDTLDVTRHYNPPKVTRSPIKKPEEVIIQPKGKKGANIWDYFSQVLDGMRSLTPNKNIGSDRTQANTQDYRKGSPSQAEELNKTSLSFQNISLTSKNKEPIKSCFDLLEKRKDGQNLSDLEDQIQNEGVFLKKKARKVEIDDNDEIENFDDIENYEFRNPLYDRNSQKETEAKESADRIEDEESLKESKRKRKKVLQIFDDEDEKRSFNEPKTESKRKVSKESYYLDPDTTIPGSRPFASPRATKSSQIPRSPVSEASIKSSSRIITSPSGKNHTVASNKFKRLKKLLDDKREGTNKQSVSKAHYTQESKENGEHKETCPICLCILIIHVQT